jgi:hypothetical protein
MKRHWFLLSVVVGLALAVVLPGWSAPEKPKAPELMQKKLKHAQKLLEALANNDFPALAKNADELIQISKEAEWRAIKTPRYELFSDQFRSHAEELVKHAKDKNIDGVALAYVEMTLSCVKCHKYIREVRMASLDGDSFDLGH